MRYVFALGLAAVVGCSGGFTAGVAGDDAGAAEGAAPAPDAGQDVLPEAAGPGVDAAAPDAPTAPEAGPEASPLEAAPTAPEAGPPPVEAGPPPPATAYCVAWTPWDNSCNSPTLGVCQGHTWDCSTDGGTLASEQAPNVGLGLADCQDLGSSATSGVFCCCN